MTWANGQSGPWAGTMGADQWALMVASWFPDGVIGGPNTNDLKVYADSTGMHVKIRVGTCKLVGQWANGTSESTVNVASNPSGNPRVDRVVLRRDPVAGSIDPFVIQGTPGVTPVAPVLTAQDLPLALIAVPAAAVTIAAGNVTDDRSFFPAPLITVLDTAHLPATARAGQQVYVSATGQKLLWTGSVWAVTYGDSGWQIANTFAGWDRYTGAGGYDSYIRARLLGSVVWLRGLVTYSTGTSSAVQMPTGMNPPYTHRFTAMSAGTPVDWLISTTGVVTYVSGGLTAGRDYPLDTSFTVD